MTRKTCSLRTCCGCNQKKAPAEMQRITLQQPDELRLDGKKKENGRGAYLCRDRNCMEKALRKKAFQRVFRSILPAHSLALVSRQFIAGLPEN